MPSITTKHTSSALAGNGNARLSPIFLNKSSLKWLTALVALVAIITTLIITTGCSACLSPPAPVKSNEWVFPRTAMPTPMEEPSETPLTSDSEPSVNKVVQYKPAELAFFDGIKEIRFSDFCTKRVVHSDLSFLEFPNVYQVLNVHFPPYVSLLDDPELQKLFAAKNHTAWREVHWQKLAEQFDQDKRTLSRHLRASHDRFHYIWHPDNNPKACSEVFGLVWLVYETFHSAITKDDGVFKELEGRGPWVTPQPTTLSRRSRQKIIDEFQASTKFEALAALMEDMKKKI